MLRRLLFASILMPAIALACDATIPVTVRFDHPEEFTDVKTSSRPDERARDYLLGELRDHLRDAAPKRLATGHCLALVITNVDMAGSFEPWRGPNSAHIRVIRDIYPPRIDLAFRLTDESGALLKEGRRNLVDMSFLTMSAINRHDSLDAEKRMLDAWLRREFAR